MSVKPLGEICSASVFQAHSMQLVLKEFVKVEITEPGLLL